MIPNTDHENISNLELASSAGSERSPFFQIDMSVQPLTLHFVNKVTQSVGMGIEIGMIYLMDIAGENNFRVCTGLSNFSPYGEK